MSRGFRKFDILNFVQVLKHVDKFYEQHKGQNGHIVLESRIQ